MAFQFHTIRDIRQCWLNTPENKFWVVDYMANENSTLPLSVLWDDLSDGDKLKVMNAYFETLVDDDCPYHVIISGGEVLEVHPYCAASMDDLENDMPF